MTITRVIRSSMALTMFLSVACLPVVVRAQFANVSPQFVDFGHIKMGATESVVVVVYNLSAGPLTVSGGTISSAHGFSMENLSCAGTLIAGDSCQLRYSFQPRTSTDTVSSATALNVTGNGQPETFHLSFRGTGSESLVQVVPRGVDIGEWLVGEPTVTVPITVTNTHPVTIRLSAGDVDAPFSITDTGTCGSGLAPNASCTFEYQFLPQQTAEATATATIHASEHANLLESYTIQLAGRGRTEQGIVGVAPVGIDFGDVKLGAQLSLPILVKNLFPFFLEWQSDDDGSGGYNGFELGAYPNPDCMPTIIAISKTCLFGGVFSPREVREFTDSKSITFKPLNYPDTWASEVLLHFTGSGVGMRARVSPVQIDFGAVQAGTLVVTSVTLRNTSSQQLFNITGGTVSGAFSRISTCGTQLPAGGSCLLSYRFQPPAGGEYQTQTTLSYSIEGIQESVDILLNGTGADPVFKDGFEALPL